MQENQRRGIMRSLFKKIVAVLVIGLILLGIARTPQVHKLARGIDPGPANFLKASTDIVLKLVII